MTNEEIIRLVLETQGADGLQDLVDKSKAAKASLEGVEEAGAKAAQGTANLGRTMLESGRIVQDFAQGGIGGILNNIEGFTQALGLGSGLAGAFTIAGVACSLAWPHIKNLLGGTLDGTATLNDRLDAMTKSLDALQGKAALTNKEQAEYNRLIQEGEKLAGEKTAREDKERLRALKAKDAPEAEQTAKTLQGRIAGRQNELIGQVRQGLDATVGQAARDQWQKEWDANEAALQNRFLHPDEIATLEARKKKLQEGSGDLAATSRAAEDLVTRGVMHGDRGALNQIYGMLPWDSSFRGDIAATLPQDQRDLATAPIRGRLRRAQSAFQREGPRARAERVKKKKDAWLKEVHEVIAAEQEAGAWANREGQQQKQKAQQQKQKAQQQKQEAADAQQAARQNTPEAQLRARGEAEQQASITAMQGAERDAGVDLGPEHTLAAARESVNLAHAGVNANAATLAALRMEVIRMRELAGMLNHQQAEFLKLRTLSEARGY